MKTLELSELEVQVDQLIHTVEKLQTENRSLRHKLADRIRQCTHLQESQQKATQKIKEIISQLKEELS